MSDTMTQVSGCTVESCSFNHDHDCGAFAITVAGSSQHASCGTFIETGSLGGLPKVLASVGACQRSECVHNENLMCGAHDVRIGPGAEAADCLSYQAG
ncbi:DUF1540 domain-containing protein [Galactobacter valiniphilus]|uniref:DUF1540 domain-containing protein n=1 Tax=Galactobacter valiniphilus TaxID=2676122 RepID=UPI00373631AF